MSRIRLTSLSFAALALYGAGAAHAQNLTAIPTSVSITYAKLSGTVTPGTSTIEADVDGTAYTAIPAAAWFTAATGTGIANTHATGGDTLTVAVVTAVANHMAAGVYSSTIDLQVGGISNASVAVQLTITSVTSPLSSSPATIALTYVKSGPAGQPLATTTSTISDNDTAADTYTVGAGLPSWLTVAATTGTASASTTDTVRFTVAAVGGNSLALGNTSFTVHLQVTGQPDATIVVTVTAVSAPLISTASSVPLSYTKGGSAPSGTTKVQGAGAGSVAFTLDVATVPVWLSVTGGSGTATVAPGGATVTFTGVSAIISTMATGNYTTNVGFIATGFPGELLVPVTLTINDTTPTLSMKEGNTGATIPLIYFPGTPLPTPVVTEISSNAPISFTAACAVTTNNPAYAGLTPCTLSDGSGTPAASVTGVAYTVGAPVVAAFDNSLFNNGTPFGTIVTLTVTTHSGAQTLTLRYQYTVQQAAPTFTSMTPTSAKHIAVGSSLVVTLTGTNFVGPGAILSGSPLSVTRVFVTAGNTDITSNSVVLNPTTLMVTIPEASFPVIAAGKTSAALAIGVANQTTPTSPVVPTASLNLNVTTNPVIYSVTSTATYNQPAPGAKPSVAPYQLISIFGDNFGPVSGIAGTPDSFSKFPASLTLSGTGATATLLKVTFKTVAATPVSFSAPILFANATQINAAVPSGVTVGTIMNVVVTSGVGATAPASDNFPANIVVADPGIFTLSSAGVGPGAILNQDFSVNKVGNEAAAGDIIQLYLTGLGAPNSVAVDNVANSGGYPAGCVQVSNTTKGSPGYMEVVNTAHTGYVPPSPAWTNIDGAAILGTDLLGSSLPPCFTNVAATNVTVTFGTGVAARTSTGSVNVPYVGFAPGAVAGLYQINVKVPVGVSTGAAVPVMITLGTEGSSPAGVVTMALH